MSCSCKIGGGLEGICFECRSRAAFHVRLKKLEDSAASAEYERGIAEGERRERSAVVAWLHDMAPTFRGVLLLYRDALMRAAERIEAGEHKETT